MRPAATDVAHVRVTPLQEGMIAAAQGRPWLYIEQIVVHLDHALPDPDQLSQAFAALMQQQPVLSMSFDRGGSGVPRQQPSVAMNIPLEVRDWHSMSRGAQARAMQAFLQADRQRGCDLSSAPCFRLTLIRTGPDAGRLVWTFPHALLDGRSFAPLLARLFENLAAIRAGTPPDTAPAPDADAFQRHCRRLEQFDHAEGIAHFAETLEGWDGSNDIVEAGARPARKITRAFRLTPAQTDALADLARAAEVSPSSLVIAAWGMVLARVLGRADALFGVTRNGRHLVEGAECAPGCFIVTNPLRVTLSEDMTVGTLLRRVRADQTALRPFEQTPLSRLRQVSDVPPGRPLLSSVLMFETGTLNDQMQALGGEWMHRHVELHEEDDVPLTLGAYWGAALEVVAEYDPAQVSSGAALLGYLETLLASFARATPNTWFAALEMIGSKESALLDDLSGRDHVLTPPATCCVTAFEEMAARYPKAPALRAVGGADIGYEQLDRAANHLALALQARGVGPGDRIGIRLPRGPLFVLAMLGAWKAGAAFVPMDPSYPPRLLEIMAEDSEAKLILTQAPAPALAAPAMVLEEDALRQGAARGPDRRGMAADRLAYVLFTSGTTGRPKGVMVSHASLRAHAAAVTDLFALAPRDQVLQFASLSFDVAIEEIVPTLLAGACLVLRSEEMAQSIPAFLAACAEERLSLLNLPTGFWVELVRHLEDTGGQMPPEVRLLVVGGERVPLSVLRRWRALMPGLRTLNGYGLTETTITCTAQELDRVGPKAASVPIGRPLGHAVAEVRAADGSRAPLGSEGELCISGPAVAEGYAATGASSRTRFRQTPQAGRSFRTGDRVYWQGDALHFVGRMDRQIKLRGYRLDPGQVESLLDSRPEVLRAHVAVPAKGPLAGRLVGWYSHARSAADPGAELRASVETQLPAHLRPILVEVDHWPQTKGGKIDESRLPVPEPGALRQAPEAADDRPETKLMVTLFEEVLETYDVQPGTSFFDAGGDSLSVLRLLSLVEKRTGQQLSAAQVYSALSPAEMGQLLRTPAEAGGNVVPLQDAGTGIPIYALHALGENYSFFLPLSRALRDSHPFFAISIGLRVADFPGSVEKLGAYYTEQIMRHRPDGPLALVAVSASAMIAFETAQQLVAARREVRGPFFFDSAGPGGRARKGRMASRWVHARMIAKHGLPYLANLRRERRFEARHREALTRVGTETNMASATRSEVLSAGEFVAATELAIEDYVPRPYPRKVTIFRADDPFDARAVHATGLGWSGVAAGGFEVIDVQGGHIDMLYEPHVKGLAAQLAKALAAA